MFRQELGYQVGFIQIQQEKQGTGFSQKINQGSSLLIEGISETIIKREQ